tara:strand:+ start:152 stop:379 length:228 start_codon:yes stop_codon:yes gene_type:complete
MFLILYPVSFEVVAIKVEVGTEAVSLASCPIAFVDVGRSRVNHTTVAVGQIILPKAIVPISVLVYGNASSIFFII